MPKQLKMIGKILAAGLSAAIFVLAVISCGQGRKLRAETYSGVDGGGWGYDIYLGDTLRLINQPFVPAVSGKKGFASQKEAEQVAQLVIKKLKKGITPPIITRDELDSLKVSY